MDNYIGRLLDNRYEIIESIGTGGMAAVYKARCHRLNRMVAIKVLKDELSVDAEFRRRFHAESQAVAMLSHPNIVNVYDVSHSENIDYIVMELIEGLTLKQYMQEKGALNWREALHLSTQIAKALEHAHGRGIIHRDIKPHNIMILKDGTVKVTDFGIARVSSAQNTLTREALGSVHYISPEQAKGGKIDYRSDIYSLGVVMYEMLTGQTPYDGETPVAVAIKHINAQAELPRTLNAQIPVGLEQITMHAMAADLEKRYENATEMLADLDEFRRNPNINFLEEVASVQQAAVVSATSVPQIRTVAKKAASRANGSKRSRSGNSGGAALVAGVICIVLALLFIGYFLYAFIFADILHKTEEVEVPNFIGLVAEQIDPARYPNLTIDIAEWRNSEVIEMGKVIDQEPEHSRMVKSGASVKLIVSSGPSTDTMRDLINYMEQNARTILDNLGLDLQINVISEPSDVISEGAIIRTEPAAQAQLTKGQTVTLVVSSGTGTKYVPVPELVGMDVDAARQTLDDLGLHCSVRYVDADETEGTVVFQSIKQMEQVKEGTTINLQISNGPPIEEEDDKPSGDPKIIWLPMPEGDETVEVRVLVDDEEAYEFMIELNTVPADGVPISPDVQGIHTVDVYIDNELWHTMIYDFDAGEQLEE